MDSPGIIILAAGASSRLGQPKQLLPFQGTTLIQRIVQIALNAICNPVVVVLGANAELIKPRLTRLPVHIAENPDWAVGLSTSIRTGLQAMLGISPQTEAAIFAVCDQPHLYSGLLLDMIAAADKSGKPIVACAYDHALGTPVLFSKAYFDELLTLNGKEGARKIIQLHPQSVEAIPFPLGIVDIDTMQDYVALQ
jgi:molybdenum cofactor cytidylyltransferase